MSRKNSSSKSTKKLTKEQFVNRANLNEIAEMIKSNKNKLSDLNNIKVKVKFKNLKQKKLYETILENRITFITGPAGTGKSIISLMAALEFIKNPIYNINKIVLTKPIIEAASSIGYLPGSIEEKTNEYFVSFFGNLNKIVGEATTGHLRHNKIIEPQLLNFMRGNTCGSYDESGNPIGWIIIGDEFQSTTIKELKLFISRLGENSRMIILGDLEQTDLKLRNNEKSGLDDALTRFKGLKNVGFVEFTEDDIVRDPFLINIMKRYKL